MLSLLSILFGAALALSTAYAIGVLCLRGLPAPRTTALAVGAAVESSLVFLLLLAGIANALTFLLLSFGALAACGLTRGISHLTFRVRTPRLGDLSHTLFAGIVACYGILYLVHALAPEIQPDGVGYHLGLVAQYHRLSGFPNRLTFFEMVPQGLEMLFLVAFTFGRHSAAKLVHFAFLVATLPLILRIGRKLLLKDSVSTTAAALYFCAPVVGLTGTCSYNDAALVFFVLATFCLLLEDGRRHLFFAGLLAGFCYAIKFPGIVVLPLAALFVVLQRRNPLPLILAGLAMFAPWMVRNAVLTGNPLAPLFNRWFPNPYFHAYMEKGLTTFFTTYGGFTWKSALFELSAGGRLQGIFGPLFLAFPLGLLALRRRAGRLLWAAALLLAVPWIWNHGARFLMPSLPFLALAFVMMLPRPAAWACLVLQAVTCWPNVIALYDRTHIWRLSGFPWQSALRIQPESDYLGRETDDFKIARMVNGATRANDKIFSLIATPAAYVDRESLDFWHSAQSDTLVDALRVAGQYLTDPFYDVKASWPEQPLRGLRVRLGAGNPNEWCIHELQLYSGEDRIYNSPQWRLRAWPNASEVVLALDSNLATRWRTWEPMRRGMYVELDLDRSQLLSGAIMVSHTPVFRIPFEFYGRGVDGKWRVLSSGPAIELRKHEDLRMAASRAVRRAGFTCMLASADFEGLGLLGGRMRDHPDEWGLETVGQAGDIHLFRIR